ncbi:AraC family transcriptional regulator [Paraferrimonas sedimenticola]|uniref:HTH araC/xylS-type domain-containing protein n=1 Tax=Paraferrimonas sedimenticola TaxID=375674 RepID=A0AA37RRU4_9GAMM|nr:AraC family transcriptional regulator [Paraferrimonas sedimenticola]GLP94893.1 hypothetical protein GCM10007895_01990 [Paraferrimonas sedimenticola]
MDMSNEPRALAVISNHKQLALQGCHELEDFCEVSSIEIERGLTRALPASAAASLLIQTKADHRLNYNLAKLRELNPKLPIFLVSAVVTIPLMHQCLRQKVSECYVWPFSAATKQDLIEQLRLTKVNCVEEDKLALFSEITANEINNGPFNRLLGLIEDSYQCNTSLKQLAPKIHLSPSRLSHMFKDLCGIGFSQYIMCRRLEQSEQLLNEGLTNVTQVAYQLGFANVSHFCRSFKRHFGITPTAFLNGERSDNPSETFQRYSRLRLELLPWSANDTLSNSSEKAG